MYWTCNDDLVAKCKRYWNSGQTDARGVIKYVPDSVFSCYACDIHCQLTILDSYSTY